MGVLETNLCKQYGVSSCLTSSQLDWSNGVSFQPDHVVFDPLKAKKNPDGMFDRSLVEYGHGVVSLGQYDPVYPLEPKSQKGMFLFGLLLKIPNNDHTYRLPEQISFLRPAIEKAARDHQEFVRASDTYYCGIMYRSLPLLREQIAENWHVHKVFSKSVVPKERAETLEIPPDTMDSIGGIADDMVAIEYLVSDRLGSYFQTKATNVPLALKETQGDFRTEGFPKAYSRTLADREIVRGNSYVFHRAASVPEGLIGQKRSLLAISFMPSQFTKTALNL